MNFAVPFCLKSELDHISRLKQEIEKAKETNMASVQVPLCYFQITKGEIEKHLADQGFPRKFDAELVSFHFLVLLLVSCSFTSFVIKIY